jgi:hypothetical protein
MSEKHFIYIIEDREVTLEKFYLLYKVENESTFNGFENYSAAKTWIEAKGLSNVDYTILPVIRKP